MSGRTEGVKEGPGRTEGVRRRTEGVRNRFCEGPKVSGTVFAIYGWKRFLTRMALPIGPLGLMAEACTAGRATWGQEAISVGDADGWLGNAGPARSGGAGCLGKIGAVPATRLGYSCTPARSSARASARGLVSNLCGLGRRFAARGSTRLGRSPTK